MAFVLTEEQQLLRDTAAQFFAEQLPTTVLRDLRDKKDEASYDKGAWKKMSELGFPGILIPESLGGSDFGALGMGLILQEAGRNLSPSPLYASGVLAAATLLECGSDAQQKEWLPKIASGETIATIALDESGHHALEKTACEAKSTAKSNGDALTLTGKKMFVPDGQNAQILLVLARTSGAVGESKGLSLFLVPHDAKGLTSTPLTMADSRASAMVELQDVQLPASALIGERDNAAQSLAPVLDLGCVMLAAEMLGGIEAVFDTTLAWLKERKQFGSVIGSFQALQHRAAEMYCEIEICRSVVLDGLSAAEEKRNDLSRIASLTKSRLGDASRLITNEGVQMHGGVGMTDELDMGLYMKRARVQAAMLGDGNYHTSRYARLGGY